MSEIKAKGIDVSSWQGKLDWAKIKAAGIDFAILRAGYGANNIDSTFMANAKGAAEAGVAIGAYWFSYAMSEDDAKAEADYLCAAVKSTGVKFTYPLCYDYEYDSYDKSVAKGVTPTNAMITAMAKAFLSRVQKNGYYPANYTNVDYLNRGFASLTDTYDLWLAQWANSHSRECGLWQYSSTGTIAGCYGNFDMDYAYKDYPSLIAKAGLNGLKDNSTEKENKNVKYTASKILEIAKAEIGYHEKASNANLDSKTANSGSGNWTKYARDLNEAGYYNGNKNGYAWCDAFVDWCFLKLCNGDSAKAQELECQTGELGAACPYSANYYKQQGRYDTTPKVGDQIFFKQNGSLVHTGLVEWVSSSQVGTIEGNAGDQVGRHTYSRSSSYIGGYGHPKYDAEAGGTTNTVTVRSTVRSGSYGDDVRDLQAKLNALGYDCGSVDGSFGSKTLSAVKAFQSKNGLTADGVVGPLTWAVLDGNGASANTSSSTVSGYPVLKRGSSGTYVRTLQTKLNTLGYNCGSVDGAFGAKTLAAVRSFQKNKGLTVDGVVGKNTWAALYA